MSDYDKYTIEVVIMIREQSNISRKGLPITDEQAALALIKAHGNTAQAVLDLTDL